MVIAYLFPLQSLSAILCQQNALIAVQYVSPTPKALVSTRAFLFGGLNCPFDPSASSGSIFMLAERSRSPKYAINRKRIDKCLFLSLN
jgi:hypothetical protein